MGRQKCASNCKNGREWSVFKFTPHFQKGSLGPIGARIAADQTAGSSQLFQANALHRDAHAGMAPGIEQQLKGMKVNSNLNSLPIGFCWEYDLWQSMDQN